MRIFDGRIGFALVLSLAGAPAVAGVAEPDSVAVPTPPKGMGEVVFFRGSGAPIGITGLHQYGGISCAVSENGKKVSSLPDNRYFIAIASPGRHTYTAGS